MKRLLFLLILAHGVSSTVRAELDPSAERIREGESRQEQLRGDAQRLVEQLDGMLDEYQRNDLGGDEIKTLRALRDSLAKLSVEEMKQVVDLLEQARAARTLGEARQRVADAYTDQKAILARISGLLAEHLRNQQGEEIAQQLAQLAERQAVNLQNGITLGQWSGDRKAENFEEAAQANLQGQQAEQDAIAGELKTMAQRIASFARDADNAAQAQRFQRGLEAIRKVQPNVDAAVASLKSGQLFKAVGDEKIARDAMRRLARDIAPPQERKEALRSAERELAKAIEDQKELVKDTEKAAGEQDFDRWLDEQKKLDQRLAKVPLDQLRKDPALQQRFNAQRNGQTDELAGLENKQGDLAARTDEISQSLSKTAPEASRDVKAGTDKMQEARGAMADRNAPAASKNTQDALAALQAADANLQQELAKSEALAGKSGDPVKDLQALQQQAQALAQQQAEAARNPDKAGQPAMAQKVEEFAKQAAMAPAAAPAAQQAAANAKQAAQAAQPAAAAPAQQAAAQALAQAAQQIAQQAVAAQQAQQQLAAAQQAQEQLAGIIAAEQKLQIDTAKSMALVEKDKSTRRKAFSGQASRQQEVATQTGTYQKTLPPDSTAANAALETAQVAMTDAKEQLDKPAGEPAKGAEAKAVEQLYAAQSALQAAAAQAQEALGPDAGAPSDATAQRAAAELAQAQEEVAQASKALEEAQKAPNPEAAQQAAEQLAKAAAQAGQAAAQVSPTNGPAQQALQAAAQAAVEAAGQAAAQKLSAAQKQAAAAQQALTQAQSALTQAQAGLTAANNPGKPAMPGNPSGSPGQKPGQTPGNKAAPPGTEPAQQDKPDGNEPVEVGARAVANGKTAFAALPARERAVIEQAQSEKYPEEYGAQIEQYLLNLARESAATK